MSAIAQRESRDRGSKDLVDLYWHDIRRCEPVTREKEVELVEQARLGNQGAMDELISSNLRFVVSVAREYANTGESLAELISDGNLGLMEAAKHYDEKRGFKFITYAVWWIRQSIRRAVAQRRRTVPRPCNRLEDLKRVRWTESILAQTLGRVPTIGEVASRAEISVERVRRAHEASASDVSLDRTVGEDDEVSVLSMAKWDGKGTEEEAEERDLAAALSRCMSVLDERERKIIKWYYGFDGHRPMTLEQIGRTWGMTRERVRQLRNRGLDKLRSTHGDRLVGMSWN